MTFSKKQLSFALVTAAEALRNDLGQNEESTNHLLGMRQLYSHSNSAAAERAEKIMRGELPPQTDFDENVHIDSHFRDANDDPNKILNALSLVERAAQLVSASQPVDVDAMSTHIQKLSDSLSLESDSDSSLASGAIGSKQKEQEAASSSLLEQKNKKKSEVHVDSGKVQNKKSHGLQNEEQQASEVLDVDATRIRTMQAMSEKMVEMVNTATKSDAMWKLWTNMANQTGLFGDFVHGESAISAQDADRLRVENDALVSKLLALRQEESAASQQLQQASGDLQTIKSKMESEVEKLSVENQRYKELAEHLQGQSAQLAESSQELQQKKANLLHDIQAEKATIEHVKTDIASVQQSNDRLSLENQRMRAETEHFAEEVSALEKKTAMVDEMQRAIGDATGKLDDLSQKNQALRLVQNRLKKETAEITQAQAASRGSFEELSRQNEELASENGALRSSLQRLKTDTNLLQERNGALENTLDGFQGSLRSMANVGSAANIARLAKGTQAAAAHQPRFRGAAALIEE